MERKHKGYQVDEVLVSLKRKKDLQVSVASSLITVNIGERRTGDVGNGTRGKMDFLKNYHGYTIWYQS